MVEAEVAAAAPEAAALHIHTLVANFIGLMTLYSNKSYLFYVCQLNTSDTIRLPGRLSVSCGIVSQPRLSASIGCVHDVYLLVAIYVATKGNLCTIRRPARK